MAVKYNKLTAGSLVEGTANFIAIENQQDAFVTALANFDDQLARFDAITSAKNFKLVGTNVPGSLESLIGGYIEDFARKLEPVVAEKREALIVELHKELFKPLMNGDVVFEGWKRFSPKLLGDDLG